MADNFLEKHREDYELRKAKFNKKTNHLPKSFLVQKLQSKQGSDTNNSTETKQTTT